MRRAARRAGRARGATERKRTPQETVAKMRESTTLPVCHATHGHSRMSREGVLQQSPQQPDPERREGARPKNESQRFSVSQRTPALSSGFPAYRFRIFSGGIAHRRCPPPLNPDLTPSHRVLPLSCTPDITSSYTVWNHIRSFQSGHSSPEALNSGWESDLYSESFWLRLVL